MKKLNLRTAQYNYLIGDFRQWLVTLGYSAAAVANFPNYIKEMLHHLESDQGVRDITQVKSIHVNRFVNYLYHRPNERGTGGLSAHSINNITTAINLFINYLHLTARHMLDLTLRRAAPVMGEREILTIEEIKELYAISFDSYKMNSLAMGQRDRAMLAVYYGCGLRKAEGEELNLDDIDLEKARLLVRKGKGNRERYVPIAAGPLEDLRSYINEGREWFKYEHKAKASYNRRQIKKKVDIEALFLSMKGIRMRDGLYVCLKKLVRRAGIQKQVGLHSLRHSIATHLLQAGMPLEEIARFLGHRTLESTQIYTHIAHILKMKELEASCL